MEPKFQEVRDRVAFSLSHPLKLPPQAAGVFRYELDISTYGLLLLLFYTVDSIV